MIKRVNAGNVVSKDDSVSETIRIKPNDRVLILGATGSGKSTLSTILLVHHPYHVVLDPKHQFTYQRGVRILSGDQCITSDLNEAYKYDEPYPVIYRPSVNECKDGCAAFWDWIWYRRNCIVYVDEVMAVSPSVNMPFGYQRAVQMGRSHDIGVWSTSQRPARIPQNLISESEHIIAFELRNPNDIKRVADFTDPIILSDRATKHDFWYYNVRDREPIKLNGRHIRVGKTRGTRT
jgi:energy-coupling factor transporter ATP-binding protein EcfA2